MQVLDPACTVASKVVIPVFVGTFYSFDVVLRETQINPELWHIERISFLSKRHAAFPIRPLFSVVLKRINVVGVLNKEPWDATVASKKSLRPEISDEANG